MSLVIILQLFKNFTNLTPTCGNADALTNLSCLQGVCAKGSTTSTWGTETITDYYQISLKTQRSFPDNFLLEAPVISSFNLL